MLTDRNIQQGLFVKEEGREKCENIWGNLANVCLKLFEISVYLIICDTLLAFH